MKALQTEARTDLGVNTLQWASWILGATVWLSALIFGLYILVVYAYSLFSGEMMNWNDLLPGLYDGSNRTSTVGIGLHFLGGGLLLIFGCIQLLEQVRNRYPLIHRVIGRIYVIASLVTALGGFAFILFKGTIGGWIMDVGFGLYGLLMLVAAWETIRRARKGQFELHRAWALRLFALTIASWLYRMEYGFWFMLADGWGHQDDFHGSFDFFMDFFFYIPNLMVAEIVIRRVQLFRTPALRFGAAAFLLLAISFILLGSYYFTRHLWAPAIIGFFRG